MEGSPVGDYDIQDILPKDIPRERQSQEISNFLQKFMPDLNDQATTLKGVWACHLYGFHVAKPAIIEEAVMEALGDDVKVAHYPKGIWSLVYSGTGRFIGSELQDKALVHKGRRRAVIFRSLVPSRHRNFKVCEVSVIA